MECRDETIDSHDSEADPEECDIRWSGPLARPPGR